MILSFFLNSNDHLNVFLKAYFEGGSGIGEIRTITYVTMGERFQEEPS